MHVPDNYLGVSTCATLAVASAPVLIHSIRKVARDFPKERFSALGVAAAFSFLAMMFNVPLPGGTTGHAVGGTVLAVLLGPEAACVAIAIALTIQALLFGDGGVVALGANIFNMAIVLTFGGYFAFVALRKLFGVGAKSATEARFRVRDCVAVGIASYVGLNLAALAAGVEFGIQPSLCADEAGRALYCPYPLSVSIPAMALGHLTLFGLAEVLFSVAVYGFAVKAAPGFATNEAVFAAPTGEEPSGKRAGSGRAALYFALALLIALTPLGLLAQGTAWGEWGADEIAETTVDGKPLGYTPEGMANGFEWSSLMPDYSASGLPDWFAYVLAAIVGVSLSVVLFKLASVFVSEKKVAN